MKNEYRTNLSFDYLGRLGRNQNKGTTCRDGRWHGGRMDTKNTNIEANKALNPNI